MPIGNVLVCNAGGDIEHNDGALAVDTKRVNLNWSRATARITVFFITVKW
jgi:hypothetical protein